VKKNLHPLGQKSSSCYSLAFTSVLVFSHVLPLTHSSFFALSTRPPACGAGNCPQQGQEPGCRGVEHFYRVDEARNRKSGGHGLGLAIAASAVRRHGGRICASNRKGGGFEVVVDLPESPK